MSEVYEYNGTVLSESELIRRIKDGETQLFPILSDKFLSVIHYCLSSFNSIEFDKDDLVQEGLIALYCAVGVYDSSISSFKTFASVCIKRGIISAIRRFSKKKHIPSVMVSSLEDVELYSDDNPEEFIIDKEDFYYLTDRIKLLLSSFEYSVLGAYLKYGNYSDVCKNLSITNKELNNALQRIRKKIIKISR